MDKKRLLSVFGTALALMVISCDRIDQPEGIDFRASAEGIPLAHGRLVSATVYAPDEVMLWFEQPDQSVIGIRVNTTRSTVSDAVITIPRN